MKIKKITRVEGIKKTKTFTNTSRDTAKDFREALKDAAKRSKDNNDSRFDQFIRKEEKEGKEEDVR